MTRLLSIALLLTACQSVPVLHPRVIVTNKSGAFVYDTMMRTTSGRTLAYAARALDRIATFPPDQPVLVPLMYHGAERYQLIEPWSFELLGTKQPVPLGIIVDGASVPRIFWTFCPPDGTHRAGALGHDLSYQVEGHLIGITITRKQADELLYNCMIEAGVSKTRACIVYEAVRAFGGSSWGGHAPIIEPVPQRMTAMRIIKPRNFLSHIYAE